jgi:hypothetical protein
MKIARLLRLLLIATLVFNGFSAPLVMAQMAHEPSSGHAGVDHANGQSDASASMHAMHHMDATASAEAPHSMVMDGASPGDCCDGATCQCGCVLPPVTVVAAMTLGPQLIAVLSRVVLYDRVSVTESTPPFRPPAV